MFNFGKFELVCPSIMPRATPSSQAAKPGGRVGGAGGAAPRSDPPPAPAPAAIPAAAALAAAAAAARPELPRDGGRADENPDLRIDPAAAELSRREAKNADSLSEDKYSSDNEEEEEEGEQGEETIPKQGKAASVAEALADTQAKLFRV